MKEPFMKMHKPWKIDYQERTKEITVYSGFVRLFSDECRSCGEEECVCEEEDSEPNTWFSCNRDQPSTPRIPFDKMTLQKIIDLLPEDVGQQDVKMDIQTDSGDYPSGVNIRFYYTKTFPTDMEAYERDMAKYNGELAVYNKQLAKYNKQKLTDEKRLKQQEMQRLQEQLNKLKDELDE